MIYTVTSNPSVINFSPSTVIEEIFQNVYTIITTTIFSVPLFRSFGIEATYLDEANAIAKAKLIADIVEKVQYFENRVIVEEVKFEENEMDGKLYPVVIIRIKEGVVS